MSTRNYLIFLSITLLNLWSCEKEVTDVDPPKINPMLVIYSFISPSDSMIYVNLTKSVPYFGEGSNAPIGELVADAVVILSSDNQSITLMPDNFNLNYQASTNNFPIVAGKKYTLRIATPGGLYCTAETTVPLAAPASYNVTMDSVVTKASNGEKIIRYKITSSWIDVRGTDNFYRVTSSLSSSIDFGNNGLCNLLFTDVDRNGEKITRSCDFEFGYYGFEPTFGYNDTSYLLTTDYSYFRYHTSLMQNPGDDDPFSEPAQIYTNIEGGLGCFGSYIKLAVPLRP